MITPRQDLIGIEIIEDLAAIGCDYIELSIRDLAALPEPAFMQILKRIEASGIRCESCNNFFPGHVRLTGPNASLPAAVAYATTIFERAAQLGASVIVFGSADAKNVPAGFPHQSAWKQVVALLQALGPLAGNYGITIVIEPLNTRESNLVNTAGEGLALAREVGHPNVQLLIDYYHLRQADEDPAIVLEAGEAIRHLHFAEPIERGFPLAPSAAYDTFFSNLGKIGYSGRCSIEAYTQNFISDAKSALAVMKMLACPAPTR